MCPNNFCVSFAEPRDADWCLKHAQLIMWDNGAYSIYTRTGGKDRLDTDAYYDWLENKMFHPHFAIVPDVIGGTEEENDQLSWNWPFNPKHSAIVYHFGESKDRLRRIIDEWPRFAIGGSVGENNPGTDSWKRELDSIWNVVEKSNAHPMVHMMRAHSEASMGGWPFYSADSASWARHHAEYGPLKWDILHNINRKNPHIVEDKNLDLFT